MFKFIEGMPPGVVAIEAIGEVTHEDYRDTLVPRAKTMVGNGPIKMIYVIGKDFTQKSVNKTTFLLYAGSNVGMDVA
jgi:hypothetical protein